MLCYVKILWGVLNWIPLSLLLSLIHELLALYEGVTKSFRTDSIKKYSLTTINTRWEATQSVMATKLTRL